MEDDFCKMINKNDIKKLHNFDIKILKEALRQTELRVNYTIDTKKRLDTKAFALLTLFISFIGLFCIPINTGTDPITLSTLGKIIFYASSFLLALGVYNLYKALKSTNNATIGRYPDTWLYDSSKIAGDYTESQQSDNNGYIMTRILIDYQESIEIADKSNDYRVQLINKAIGFGILAVIPLFIPVFGLLHHFL